MFFYANSAKMIECSVLHCFGCYDTMANYFKAKMGFVKNEKGFWDILGSEAPLCESSHSVILRNVLCDNVGLRAMGIISFILRLCANVFGVGPESDGEALTDRWSRPWG